MQAFSEMSMLSTFAQPAATACVDTPLWDNHSGRRCADYAREGWCRSGSFVPAFKWTGGAQFKCGARESNRGLECAP